MLNLFGPIRRPDHSREQFMPRPDIDQQITFVYCKDLEACARFYTDVLGLALAIDQGDCRIFRGAAEAFVGLCRCRPDHGVSRDGVTLTFVTPDVDGWHRHLKEHSVEILAPPSESREFQIYRFFARDPEGHLLEFQRFLSPDWPPVGSP
jgi:catechol 2,3-dioxygenase-like lactoylglutathione lyase family enzyme